MHFRLGEVLLDVSTAGTPPGCLLAWGESASQQTCENLASTTVRSIISTQSCMNSKTNQVADEAYKVAIANAPPSNHISE